MITAIFPDPDLLPLVLEAGLGRRDCQEPARTDETGARPLHGAGVVAPEDAFVLVAERELADYYEEMAEGVDAKSAANWLNNEVLGPSQPS